MNNFDILNRHTQLIVNQLRECSLVSLSVGVSAGEDLHIAGGIESNLGAFP